MKSNVPSLFKLTIMLLTSSSVAFQVSVGVANNEGHSALSFRMATNDNNEFMRWAKQSRSASVGDNVVELVRPLGLVLNEDDRGNVYVETLAPKGNAARTGKVRDARGHTVNPRHLFLIVMSLILLGP
jgi:hypothetical protein